MPHYIQSIFITPTVPTVSTVATVATVGAVYAVGAVVFIYKKQEAQIPKYLRFLSESG